jgi:hypothetical protein
MIFLVKYATGGLSTIFVSNTNCIYQHKKVLEQKVKEIIESK